MSDPRWLSDAADAGRRALRQALDESPPFAPSDVRRRRVAAELARSRARRQVARRWFIAGAALASVLTAVAFVSTEQILKWRRARDSRARPPAVASAAPAGPPPPAIVAVPQSRDAIARDPARPAAVEARASARAEETEMLAPGSAVETGPAEQIARRLVAGARADIQPGSSLAIDASARPVVRGGEVRFDVPAQPTGKPFVARIASYFVVVASARFVVRVDAGGARVVVQAGAVEIWRRGRLARVEAGDSWRHSAREPDPRASAMPALRPRFAAPGDRPGADDATDGADDAADLAAAREARATDPSRAISHYERIFARGGLGAENALYQIGGIYRDQLHDPERALAAWQRYRSRYPRGQLRVEVDLSVLDTLAELGQKSRALDEGLAFLRHHPASERRGEVARVAADLARVRGQCRLAATLYAQVSGPGVSTDDADDAAFGRASCLAALGDAGAERAVADYLATHPRGRHVGEARGLAQP